MERNLRTVDPRDGHNCSTCEWCSLEYYSMDSPWMCYAYWRTHKKKHTMDTVATYTTCCDWYEVDEWKLEYRMLEIADGEFDDFD